MGSSRVLQRVDSWCFKEKAKPAPETQGCNFPGNREGVGKDCGEGAPARTLHKAAIQNYVYQFGVGIGDNTDATLYAGNTPKYATDRNYTGEEEIHSTNILSSNTTWSRTGISRSWRGT